MKTANEIASEILAQIDSQAVAQVVAACEELLGIAYQESGNLWLFNGIFLSYQKIEELAEVKLSPGILRALDKEAAGKWAIRDYQDQREGNLLRFFVWDEGMDH